MGLGAIALIGFTFFWWLIPFLLAWWLVPVFRRAQAGKLAGKWTLKWGCIMMFVVLPVLAVADSVIRFVTGPYA